jgi:mannose-6-phosphate isomerase-like protein (cupin superfamily)
MKIISLDGIAEEGVSHNPEIRKRVMLRRGEVAHLTSFAESRLAPGQVTRAHVHADMFEVFFVVSGAGRIRSGDAEHALQAGTCIAVEPNESHEIANDGAGELVLIYFGIEA